ncbi:MAG TPA: TlpA disulfide reductase family protein [Candidatus Binataceae bacterium]|jgi:peroxiredoxin|nr:TlpA disulfide reductase family protein [Candidatus Binataceae bacterium]
MVRDAKILSVIAAAMLAVGLGLVAFNDYGAAAPADSGKVSLSPLPGGPVAAGKLAIDFKLPNLNGTAISLSSLRGKVVFLNVWATWCAPCREEMPSIETLYEEFSKDPDFVVLAVSQDSGGRSAVDSYVHRNGLKFNVLLDPQNEVGEAYDVSGIPETFIIDRAGRIVAHHVGPYDWAQPEMRDALRELIETKDNQTARAG